jgi:uncharacterized protein YfbU (UPF0304 family)
MKLSDGEKLILIMLSEIHEKLKIENGVDTKLVKEAIYSGNLWGLKSGLGGILNDYEATEEVRREAVDILDMWSFIERDYEQLSPADKERVEKEVGPLGKHVRFSGFDGNGESQYIGIARFLIEHLDSFQIFKDRDLNAHMPTIEAHRRMLKVFEPLRRSLADARLSADNMVEILTARIHPENRKRAAPGYPN